MGTTSALFEFEQALDKVKFRIIENKSKIKDLERGVIIAGNTIKELEKKCKRLHKELKSILFLNIVSIQKFDRIKKEIETQEDLILKTKVDQNIIVAKLKRLRADYPILKEQEAFLEKELSKWGNLVKMGKK